MHAHAPCEASLRDMPLQRSMSTCKALHGHAMQRQLFFADGFGPLTNELLQKSVSEAPINQGAREQCTYMYIYIYITCRIYHMMCVCFIKDCMYIICIYVCVCTYIYIYIHVYRYIQHVSASSWLKFSAPGNAALKATWQKPVSQHNLRRRGFLYTSRMRGFTIETLGPQMKPISCTFILSPVAELTKCNAC